jgi:hypothetical protein
MGAQKNRGGMDADENNTLGNQREKNVVDTSNERDFLDQEDPDQFSQNEGHACSSSPTNPRNDGHESKSSERQDMRQNIETSTPRKVSAPEMQFDQCTSSIPSKVSLEIVILEEVFAGCCNAHKQWSQKTIFEAKRPSTSSMSHKE